MTTYTIPADAQLRPDQLPFVNDNASRFAICLGGCGSGKSLCGAIKTANCLLTTPRRANSLFWVIGKTMAEVGQAAWVEKLSRYLPKESIREIRWYSTKRRFPERIELWHPFVGGENSWIIEFLSHDQLAAVPESMRVGGFWINEEIPFELAAKAVLHLEPSGRGWADFTPIEYLCNGWYDAVMNIPDGWNFYQIGNGSDNEWTAKHLESVPHSMRRTRSHGSFPARIHTSPSSA